MKNNFKSNELEGLNIYTDKKNQKIYLDPITKNGYVITPEKQNTFKVYSNTVLFAILSAIFIYMIFEFSWWICLIVGIVVFAFLQWRFRKFLANCTMYKNYKPEKKNTREIYESSTSLIIIKMALYLILSVLFIVTVVLSYGKGDVLLNGACVCCAIACAFIGFKYISVLIARKKKQ